MFDLETHRRHQCDIGTETMIKRWHADTNGHQDWPLTSTSSMFRSPNSNICQCYYNSSEISKSSDTMCLLISFSLFSCAVLAFSGYPASPPSEVFTKGVIREAFGHCVSWTQTKSSKNKPSSLAWALSFFSSWAKFSVEVHCLFLEGMTYNSRGTWWTPKA